MLKLAAKLRNKPLPRHPPPAGDGGKAPTDLDKCGGHTDKTHRFYHYHTTGLKAPYIVACLKGCIAAGASRGATATTCTKAAKQYDYSTFKPAFAVNAPATAAGGKTGRKLSAGSA